MVLCVYLRSANKRTQVKCIYLKQSPQPCISTRLVSLNTGSASSLFTIISSRSPCKLCVYCVAKKFHTDF